MSVKPHCQAISLMSLSGKLRSKVPTASIRYSLMKFVNVLPVSRLKNEQNAVVLMLITFAASERVIFSL